MNYYNKTTSRIEFLARVLDLNLPEGTYIQIGKENGEVWYNISEARPITYVPGPVEEDDSDKNNCT